MSTVRARSSLLLLVSLAGLSLAVVACADPHFQCPDGFVMAPDGRCIAVDAGLVPMGDGGGLVDAATQDAGVDAQIVVDAAMPMIDAAMPEIDAAMPEMPDAAMPEIPDAYVAPDTCGGSGAACGSNVGACRRGTMTCTMGMLTCTGAIGPTDETCNEIDDDCDGSVDEGVISTFYFDGDGDGYGVTTTAAMFCTPPSGYVSMNGDCDDHVASVHPGATEVCNGVDDNCNGQIDEGVLHYYYPDCDGDGFAPSSTPVSGCMPPPTTTICAFSTRRWIEMPVPGTPATTDCMDLDATLRPDNVWYVDCDGDGYASVGARSQVSCFSPVAAMACSQPTAAWTLTAPTSTSHQDCFDLDAHAFPGSSYFSATPFHPGGGAVSYDYNCNGTWDLQHPSGGNGTCTGASILTCGPGPTWVGNVMCGDAGRTLTTCSWGPTGCAPSASMPAVSCN